ncbi:MAG TPA: cytidylate kinase-like family protein [Gemmatimonadales bacterium]|jgi:cytidylate kinase|nr:cytidylate kinase-like family protein [Gemmatimonadales bacterium]
MLVTISRQYGAGGSEVARRVADALGWRLVDNELVERVGARAGLSAEEVAGMEERSPSFIERLAQVLATATPELFPPATGTVPELSEATLVRITEAVVAEAAAEGRAVLVGRAAPAVLAREREALHVKLVASRPFRIRVAATRLGLDLKDAERVVQQTDAQRERYHREHYARDWNDPVGYHMVLNTERLGYEGTVAIIVAEVGRRGWK